MNLPKGFITEGSLASRLPYKVQSLRFHRARGRTPTPIETGEQILYVVDANLEAFIKSEWERKGLKMPAQE